MFKLPRLAPKASKPRTEATPAAGNLCACLVTFAAWRRCCCCGALTLYVDPRCGTSTDFECGNCASIREALAAKLRPRPAGLVTCLPVRAALHLWALFGGVANDNPRARA